MFSRSKRTRVEKYLYKACLSYFAGCPSGTLPPVHFILQRGRKQQKVGANDNGPTHRGLLGGLCQELQHLHRLSGTQKDQRLGARCAHTHTCATADSSVAQDKGLAFDHGKEIDSLQSTG